MRPSAKLISTIQYPMETIYLLWQASRTKDPTMTARELNAACATNPELASRVVETFNRVIDSDIPVAENLDFIFVLDNIPISLREQIVRHRIGHHFGDNFGVDIVPGDGRSSWWSQSMRVMEMGEFASLGEYYTPDTIVGNETPIVRADPNSVQVANVEELYHQSMHALAGIYQMLVDAGIPPEDARQIVPLAASHRISWKLNYMSLKHVLGRRGCWIAQLGMWEPIIVDMVEELCREVSPVFRSLVLPPCISKKGNFTDCPFKPDNALRLKGEDPEPPCPAALYNLDVISESVPPKQRAFHPVGDGTWDATDPAKREKYKRLQQAFGKLWNRNVWTMRTN